MGSQLRSPLSHQLLHNTKTEAENLLLLEVHATTFLEWRVIMEIDACAVY